MTLHTVPQHHNKSPRNYERAVYLTATAISLLSVLYLISVKVVGRSWLSFVRIDSSSSELTLSLIQCLLGAAVLNAPRLLTRLTKIKVPAALSTCFYVFVLCATVLGEMFALYYRIAVWDSILHVASGIMSGMLGGILCVEFLRRTDCEKLISPALIAVAAGAFAICLGVVWEVYEFAGDSLLGLNMQKCLLEDGTALIGNAAVFDTMKDLILDGLGGGVAAIGAYRSVRRELRNPAVPTPIPEELKQSA